MSGRPADQIMATHRSSHAPEDEPIKTTTMTVRDFKREKNGFDDLGVTLAALFRNDLNNIRAGDELTVEIYQDKYVVRAPEPEV